MDSAMIQTILALIVCAVLMYFMAIRPQKKYDEKKRQIKESLAIGDSVKTSSGFYGVILGIQGDVVVVEFGNDKHCRIPMDINCIEEVDKPAEEA
ncbi:MAG: preprotein translocase subunit YajC [Lachnospiraceae bacterium]|nr:preprotein translocase subunit YajC [Lachnospiraceae bacterium]